MTESSKPPNKDLERFIEKTTSSIRDAKNKYNYAKHLINNTPIQIKILNIAVPFSLTYLFTYVYYNLLLSIIFALITTRF